MQQFAIKAAREAKVRSNWHHPDVEYEGALTRFIEAILQPGSRFVADFERFQAYIAPFGAAASLAQLTLKATSPGVPDFYQGTLVWDFSLVDPDNRRPVNFGQRMQLWRELQEVQAIGSEAILPDLIDHWQDGRIKMYTAGKLLRYRREHKELFERGEYVPLQVRGAAARHAVAYGRYYMGEWAVTVVPRLLAALSPHCTPLAHASLWSATEISLPDGAPGAWRNVLGGDLLRGRHLPLRRVFESFPVALLSGR
jgi:(1->4)-alpha-D-glucan 1-alpha-D-glucosylmutase